MVFRVNSVISIIALTVHFLISLPFPVNWCYLNPLSLAFVPPVLLSSSLQGRGRGERESVSMVSVEALNWRIPFLNQNTQSCYLTISHQNHP